MDLAGRYESLALLSDAHVGVVIDVERNVVLASGALSRLQAAHPWTRDVDSSAVPVSVFDLASSAVSSLDINVVTASGRMYTIPKGVQTEAQRGLDWRREHGRGGTPGGLATARTLAKGGQIGIDKVRHIAKYFPRHEIDKKAKGYSPGDDSFPSNGRIAWALWGGDAAWRWARAIVKREQEKNSILASSEYALAAEYDADIDPFRAAFELDEDEAPEFVVRVRLDGSGIDRLYMVTENGDVLLWDDGEWKQFATVDGDPLGYDEMLDDPYDTVKKAHVVIDPPSALIVSARLQEQPFKPVSVYEIEPDEAILVEDALEGLDWEIIDMVAVTAAGPQTGIVVSDGDGTYSPEERSKKASQQVRDRTGKFSKSGSSVTVSGDPSGRVGTITSINRDDKTVNVQFEDGTVETVPADQTGPPEAPQPAEGPSPIFDEGPLDLRGIVAEPRAVGDVPVARLPNHLPPLTPNDISLLLADWPAWVADQRAQYAANYRADEADGDETRYYKDPKDYDSGYRAQRVQNAYNNPYLRDWLDERYRGSNGKHVYQNRGWYNPILSNPDTVQDKKPRKAVYAAATPESTDVTAPDNNVDAKDSEALTPDTSDVGALFMAIVAHDDPQAVMDLVALVPASKTSPQPATFTRRDGEWVADDSILRDLNSPTPPPVVVLDDATLDMVLRQVDGEEAIVAALEKMRDAMLMPIWGERGQILALVSAGGLDRNRGGAEKLRRYWLYGKGALKIRWNTPGDWRRCVRHLSKYMGPRAKGYCALRHKEATGMWTGDKKHRQMFSIIDGYSDTMIRSEDEIAYTAALNAQARAAKDRVLMAGGSMSKGDGAKFCIPLVIPEGKESGDGRIFEPGAIRVRDLPLPLLWQIKTADGHEGSVVIGRIDTMERVPGGIGNAHGVFDTGVYGREAERLVREGFIRGISADLDQFEAKHNKSTTDEAGDDTDEQIGGDKITINKARVMAVTLVPKPAFQECSIEIEIEETPEADVEEEESEMLPDGIYIGDSIDPTDASAIVACGMIADAVPTVPPRDWFNDPKLKEPTALTVTDDGRVFGHIAAWHVDHIGMSFGTRPPRSKSKYAYFHTGVIRTDDGSDVPVGQLTLAGGHAGLEASATEAIKHYDDTASAIADVHAGEDAYGIWVAGALRPGVTPEQVRALRASAPSGDWRPVKGSLELVAVCQVNVPGFPIARARVASGHIMALVAAGASTLARLKSDPLRDLAARVEKLEQLENAEAAEKAAAIRERFAEARAERDAVLRVKAQELSARVKAVSTDPKGEMSADTAQREKLVSEGKAMPDGSYPIADVEALKDAIQAYGRAKPTKRAQVRKHIMKRARALKRYDLIPEKWKSASVIDDEIGSAVNDMRSRIAVLTAAAPVLEDDEEAVVVPPVIDDLENPYVPEPTEPMSGPNGEDERALLEEEELEREEKEAIAELLIPDDPASKEDPRAGKYKPGYQPRDNHGRFRRVLARLKSDIGESGLTAIVEKIEEAENNDDAGDYEAAAHAAQELIHMVDRIDSGALSSEALSSVRGATTELGRVIANLPLPFGQDAQKVRYSDLPPALRDLIEKMMDRVAKKIGEEDATVATEALRSYKSGSDVKSQAEISSEMNKMLRLLT